jgi:methyl-accepting chemotaxis protein
MKVGTRLGLGFGVVILLLLIILATAIINMATMNQATQTIVSDRYAKVAILNKVVVNNLDNARQLRNMILIEDPVKVEGFRQTIDKNRAENKEALEKLDQMLKLPKGRELFNAISQTRKDVSDKYATYFDLVKKDHKEAID